MRRSIAAAIFLFLAASGSDPAMAQVTVREPDAAANAALKYWQAFALLPAVQNDQEKLLEHWNTIPFDAAALRLIETSRLARESLQRGTKLTRCDWALDYEDGMRLRLPHLQKARTLASLAALDARHEFELGHWKSGWDEVTALLSLGRHLEVEPLFVQRWVGRAIESLAIDAAAPYLPELKSVLPEAGSRVFDGSPAGVTLERIVLTEKQVFLMSAIQDLKTAEQREKGAWRGFWNAFFDTGGQGSEAERNRVRSVQTFAEATKMLDDLLPFSDQLAKLATLPWKDFDAQYPQLIKNAKAVNPLADEILPLNRVMIATERRTQTRMALFVAALAVVRDGPEKLKDIRDPFGDGPFVYRALDQGFELKSKLLYREKPVTLTVGQRTRN